MPDRFWTYVVRNDAPRSAGTPWLSEGPHASASVAWQHIQALAGAGRITLGFVVIERGGRREIMGARVWPSSARNVIGHLRALEEMLEKF